MDIRAGRATRIRERICTPGQLQGQGSSSSALACHTLRAAKGREATPGQNEGRDFCRDFAQPSQAVRGGTATPDATAGLYRPGPVRTDGPARVGAELANQEGVPISYGSQLQHREGTLHFGSLMLERASSKVLWLGEKVGSAEKR